MATTAQEIALMKQRIKSMEDKLDNLDGKLDTLTKKLLDPDDGFVVRVNRNTEFRRAQIESQPMYDELINEFKELRRWKGTVSKALWGVYAAIIGSIIKLIFW